MGRVGAVGSHTDLRLKFAIVIYISARGSRYARPFFICYFANMRLGNAILSRTDIQLIVTSAFITYDFLRLNMSILTSF